MHRVASTHGVQLVLHDLGGSGEPLLLVHATGFCAGVFRPLARALAGDFRCFAVDLRGHGASADPPPDRGWSWDGFAADAAAAAAAVAGATGRTPAALGHSSGGAALLAAEAAAPGTFSALWCYEPIVWPDPAAARPRAERLAGGARRRRDRFASREEALANFSAKPPFSVLHAGALAGYVECGFVDEPDGSLRLRCPGEAEAAIYLAALEGDRFAALAAVGCPVTVAWGETTDAVGADLAARLAGALPGGTAAGLAGLGHFGPLEDPATVAGRVRADLGAGPGR